ncbi:hypothetical protein SLS56_007725 [Neofusicoccum ribis]|uniref:Heme haloperoxidase family profile domain-containing protein n=1 Tax=Neofusicoccum ribis TaxID=45134 RepID=A0ABR3SMY0_9PEZI
MKFTILPAALTFTLAYGQGSPYEWAPAGPDDFRGPCPMMNTLANHGFLPHDGRNITRANAIHALNTGLNFATDLAGIMWDQAIIANPEPNATFFTLDNLNRHNVLEHDASMSRADAYLGNNHVFNQTIFDTTTAFWTEPILDRIQLTNGKLFRQLVSRSENPEYTFTQTTEAFSLGEVGAPVIVFGDHESVTVNRSLITYFFENERLPVELGFVKQAEPISLEAVTRISEILANASNLITPSNATAAHKRRDLHAGLFFSA